MSHYTWHIVHPVKYNGHLSYALYRAYDKCPICVVYPIARGTIQLHLSLCPWSISQSSLPRFGRIHCPLHIASCPLHITHCRLSNPFHSRGEFLPLPGLAVPLLLLLSRLANCCEYAHISPRHFFRYYNIHLHLPPQAHHVHLPAQGLRGSEADPWVEFIFSGNCAVWSWVVQNQKNTMVFLWYCHIMGPFL